ncbi:hypothetical protein HK405_009971, partial [Cladochytrium tenue]
MICLLFALGAVAWAGSGCAAAPIPSDVGPALQPPVSLFLQSREHTPFVLLSQPSPRERPNWLLGRVITRRDGDGSLDTAKEAARTGAMGGMLTAVDDASSATKAKVSKQHGNTVAEMASSCVRTVGMTCRAFAGSVMDKGREALTVDNLR